MCERILNGTWPEDDRVASVRDIAIELGVNPNTAMRAFDYLQSCDVIFNRRGVGYFVQANAREKVLALQRKYFLEEEMPYFVQKMKLLGISVSDLKIG